jgi:hypothetical protein
MLEHLRTKSPGKLGLDGGGFGSGLWMSLLMGLKAFEWLVKGWLVVLRLWVWEVSARLSEMLSGVVVHVIEVGGHQVDSE